MYCWVSGTTVVPWVSSIDWISVSRQLVPVSVDSALAGADKHIISNVAVAELSASRMSTTLSLLPVTIAGATTTVG